ncbi:MAG: hypothetical protein JWM47_4506 [Acidimicrobiales bacterium]|nr:hypothetical protein [Acidimicrobiales bacterium]
MRLTPKAVRAIERGAKTEHRVLITDPREARRPGPRGKGGQRIVRTGVSATYTTSPFRPAIGDSLVVQPETIDPDTGETKLEQVRVVVTDVDRSTLGDITPAGALAEGHPTVAAFADHWMRQHTHTWPEKTEALCKNCDGTEKYIDHDGQEVECLECELGVVMVDDTPTPEATLDHFDRKHAHHLVWVVSFELQVDVPLYLNKRAYLPPTTSLSEALEPVEILGPPRPDWAHRAEVRRREALRDRDGARLAGLDRITAELEAEALRLALESDADVDIVVRQIRTRVDTIKRKVAGEPDRRAA